MWEYIYAWLNAGHNLSSTDNDARVHKHTQWMQYQLEVSINSASWKWIPFGWIASSKFQLAAALLTLIVFEELYRLRERTLSSILIIITSFNYRWKFCLKFNAIGFKSWLLKVMSAAQVENDCDSKQVLTPGSKRSRTMVFCKSSLVNISPPLPPDSSRTKKTFR